MNETTYTKLSALVDKDITIEKVWGYSWKMWDAQSNRMIKSERYEQGFRKLYSIITDKGTLDISANQLGNMLESISKDGKADIIGQTFHVKSNGKSGVDIRYYINPARTQKPPVTDEFGEEPIIDTEQISISEIPF